MNSFEFHNPTRVVFGAGAFDSIGKHAKAHGKKALIVTTRGAVEKLGYLDKAKKLLEAEGIKTLVLSGVDPNPRLSTVRSLPPVLLFFLTQLSTGQDRKNDEAQNSLTDIPKVQAPAPGVWILSRPVLPSGNHRPGRCKNIV